MAESHALPSLTVRQVGTIIQAHPNRGWKLGPHWRVQPSDLADFIDRNRVRQDKPPRSGASRLKQIEKESS